MCEVLRLAPETVNARAQRFSPLDMYAACGSLLLTHHIYILLMGDRAFWLKRPSLCALLTQRGALRSSSAVSIRDMCQWTNPVDMLPFTVAADYNSVLPNQTEPAIWQLYRDAVRQNSDIVKEMRLRGADINARHNRTHAADGSGCRTHFGILQRLHRGQGCVIHMLSTCP